MRKYAFNDTTHELLSVYAAQPSGSILLTGVEGSGITTAITYLLQSIYGQTPKAGEVIMLEKPYTIDGVRAMIKDISLTRSNSKKPRFVVIDDANQLKTEAQNTLLKSIEEPPNNTHFILGSNHPEDLLKTIVSRCQKVDIKRPKKDDLKKLFPDLEADIFDKLYAMSDGWPGVLRELKDNPESKFHNEVSVAKYFISSTRTSKVGQVISIKSEAELLDIINGLARISRAALRSSKDNLQQEANWLRIYKLCEDSLQQLKQGIGFKLVALNLGSRV